MVPLFLSVTLQAWHTMKYNMMHHYGGLYLQSVAAVTHLAENKHVPDSATFPVGSQLLLYLLWGGREKERCHFSYSAFMVRNLNWPCLKRLTQTQEHLNNESSLQRGQLELSPTFTTLQHY